MTAGVQRGLLEVSDSAAADGCLIVDNSVMNWPAVELVTSDRLLIVHHSLVICIRHAAR